VTREVEGERTEWSPLEQYCLDSYLKRFEVGREKQSAAILVIVSKGWIDEGREHAFRVCDRTTERLQSRVVIASNH